MASTGYFKEQKATCCATPKKVYTALLQRIFKHQWNLIQAFKAYIFYLSSELEHENARRTAPPPLSALAKLLRLNLPYDVTPFSASGSLGPVSLRVEREALDELPDEGRLVQWPRVHELPARVDVRHR